MTRCPSQCRAAAPACMTKATKRRRWSLGTPFSYMAAVVIAGITLVPILYVVVGGFRTDGGNKHHSSGVAPPMGVQQLQCDLRLELLLALRR